MDTLQFVMAHDFGIGEVGLQGDEQRVEGQLLGGRSAVGRRG